MILSALPPVDETSASYIGGVWMGRLAVILLVVLLIRKYVFGKAAPRIGGRPPSSHVSASTPAPPSPWPTLPEAPGFTATGADTILPAQPAKRRRGR